MAAAVGWTRALQRSTEFCQRCCILGGVSRAWLDTRRFTTGKPTPSGSATHGGGSSGSEVGRRLSFLRDVRDDVAVVRQNVARRKSKANVDHAVSFESSGFMTLPAPQLVCGATCNLPSLARGVATGSDVRCLLRIIAATERDTCQAQQLGARHGASYEDGRTGTFASLTSKIFLPFQRAPCFLSWMSNRPPRRILPICANRALSSSRP